MNGRRGFRGGRGGAVVAGRGENGDNAYAALAEPNDQELENLGENQQENPLLNPLQAPIPPILAQNVPHMGHGNPGNLVPMDVGMWLTMVNLRTPTLVDFEIMSMKKFIVEYKRYATKCPAGLLRSCGQWLSLK